jgi:hypothetical protein
MNNVYLDSVYIGKAKNLQAVSARDADQGRVAMEGEL